MLFLAGNNNILKRATEQTYNAITMGATDENTNIVQRQLGLIELASEKLGFGSYAPWPISKLPYH